MTTESPNLSGREQRLQEMLVACLESVEAGREPDRQALLEQYPDCAAELDEFLASREHLDQLAAPWREVAAAATGAADDTPAVGGGGPAEAVPSFGDYEVLGEIARGGMGVVYRARQISLNRPVALKMILAGQLASAADVQRFRREAEVVAHLDHPGIVPIYEVNEHGGRHYFTMKLIEGGSLAQWIADCRLQIADLPRDQQCAYARLVATVARAVHHAHQHGLLHRDLKPANILLQNQSGQSAICNLQSAIPLVTDFGLAKRVQPDGAPSLSGAIVGTPAYMAPEQAAGGKGLAVAADVYSLGAILYELLTGRPPFRGATTLDTLLAVLEREPERPSVVQPGVDRDLETICLKCLEKDPNRRYGSAEDLADDLERWLNGEPIQARPAGRWERGAKWARRRPAVAALIAVSVAAVGALVVTAGLFTLSLQGALGQSRRQELLAQEQAHFAAEQEKLAKDRLWQSLRNQARAQRLAGDRWQALAALAEAVKIRNDPQLRQDAIQAITSPGLRLACKLGPRSLSIGGEGPFMQFSADARLLATTESLRTPEMSELGDGIKIWDIPSGRLVGQTQCGYYGAYYAFRPTAPVLALAGYDQAPIRLWEPATDKLLARFKGYAPLHFSPDGKLLAVVADADGKQVRVWDLDRKEQLPFTAGGTPLAFVTPDELVVHHGNQMQRWNVRTGKQGFTTPKGTLAEVWSADGRLVGVRNGPDSGRGPVTVWDLEAGKERAALPDPGPLPWPSLLPLSAAAALAAVPDPAEPYSARLIDLLTGKPRGRLTIPGFAGNALYRGHFNPAGSLLVTEDANAGNVRVWDVNTGNLLQTLPEQRCPAWSPDGRYLAVFASGWFEPEGSPGRRGGTDSHTRVYEVAAPVPTYRVPAAVEALAFAEGGRRVLAQGTVWDAARGRGPLLLRPAPEEPGQRLAYYAASPAGMWGLHWETLGAGQALKIQEVYPERRTVAFPARKETGEATGLVVSPDGKSLVLVWQRHIPAGGAGAYTLKTQMQLWDVAGPDPVRRWETAATSEYSQTARFSPDARRVALWTGGDIVLRDVETGDERRLPGVTQEEISPSHAALHNVKQMRFSPDGRLLVAALDGGAIAVADVATGKRLGLWKPHGGDVLALAVSPDGHTLASGSENGTIHLWEIATGEELARWEAHEAKVTALTFSPDGSTLVSGSGDGVCKLWDLPAIRKELAGLGLDW